MRFTILARVVESAPPTLRVFVSIILPLILFMFFRRQIVVEMTTGAIKG